MNTHRRYLDFRTERLERQNRWLTILAGAAIIIMLLVVMAGPTFMAANDDNLADSDAGSTDRSAVRPDNN